MRLNEIISIIVFRTRGPNKKRSTGLGWHAFTSLHFLGFFTLERVYSGDRAGSRRNGSSGHSASKALLQGQARWLKKISRGFLCI